MSTFTTSPTPSLVPQAARSADGQATPNERFDSARSLSALLMAAAVAALVVLADQLIDTWVDGHLFLGWVALWVVIFAGSVLFAGTARQLARTTVSALDSWSRSLGEARAETRLWELAKMDPRIKAELMQARARQLDAATAASDATRDSAIPATGAASPTPISHLAPAEMSRHAGYLPHL